MGDQHAIPAGTFRPAANRSSAVRMVEKLSTTRFVVPPPPAVRRLLLHLLQRPGIDHDRLDAVSMSVIKTDERFNRLIGACAAEVEAAAAWVRMPETRRVLADEFLHAVLQHTTVRDLDVEQLVSVLRMAYLELAAGGWPEVDVEPDLALLAALACQCHRTEYIYAVMPEERGRLDHLRSRLESLRPDDETPAAAVLADLAVYGMHRPFSTLEGIRRFLAAGWREQAASLYDVVAEQVRAHDAEQEIRREIQSLGMSDDAVSVAVREHYEDFPYPRWFTFQAGEPRPFQAAMAERFPFVDLPAGFEGPVEILIAGCGTGRHALDIAAKYSDARVTAIDISKASLAHAVRKAREYGVSNVEFRRADILCLKDLTTRFHLVEAVGVPHCMADPVAGWRILTDLLHPGGFMKVGLYSRHARACLDADRRTVRAGGADPPSETVQRLRQEMMARERASGIRGAIRYGDFYAESELRDLLFHVREVEFTLPEIADILRGLGLTFLGFRSSERLDRFKSRFPDGDLRDLALWDRLEKESPDTFWSMYVFWAHKGRGANE